MKKNAHKTILVIEDSPSLNRVLVERIETEDFNTLSAFNGREGLDIAYSKKPDLILLNITMPVLDGYGFFEQLRENSWGKDAKVIILTNLSIKNERLAKLVVQKNPIAFLTKSSTKLRDLMRYIHYALDEES